MARFFFAVWPDAEAARSLAEVSRSLAALAGGKPVPPEKIHLTLAFLGSVDAAQAQAAREVAPGVRARAFEIVLDQVGSFRGARVGWAGCSRPPEELTRLAAALAEGLRARDLELDDRPFAPHVTLARRIAKPVPRAPMPPLAWRARELALVRSETGTGRYVIEEKWPFAGP